MQNLLLFTDALAREQEYLELLEILKIYIEHQQKCDQGQVELEGVKNILQRQLYKRANFLIQRFEIQIKNQANLN